MLLTILLVVLGLLAGFTGLVSVLMVLLSDKYWVKVVLTIVAFSEFVLTLNVLRVLLSEFFSSHEVNVILISQISLMLVVTCIILIKNKIS
jgi:hypothetical protein